MQRGSYARNMILAGSADYNGSVNITIPANIAGNYYVVLRTDNDNRLFEFNGETNNIVSQLISVTAPDPADLEVSNIVAPDTVVAGESVNILYTIKNVGLNPAIGSIRDAAYLSLDRTFDGGVDQLFEKKDYYINLQPGDSLVTYVGGKMPGLVPGNYVGINRINITNTIIEGKLENNIDFTQDSIVITIEELTLGVPSVSPLDYRDKLYYKVFVGDNQDMIISLTSNQQQGTNEIYVAYERIPTPNDYDFVHPNAAGFEHEILVPETQEGYYYIHITTPSSFYGFQDINILADVLPSMMVLVILIRLMPT